MIPTDPSICMFLYYLTAVEEILSNIFLSLCVCLPPDKSDMHWWFPTKFDIILSCNQAALWMVQSVRPSVSPSVRLSICHTFFTMFPSSYRMKFSGVITNDRSDVHGKDQGQTSKVKVTEVKTKFSRFLTLTPVWIHIWPWNDAQSLMLLRRGTLLFLKVIR